MRAQLGQSLVEVEHVEAQMRVADLVRAPRAAARLGRRLGEADQLDAHAVALHVWKPPARSDDGSSRSAKTNDFIRTSSESNSASQEWALERVMYWYPTPNTPN